ncbi:hypothetical protein FOCC_FOCC013784 [Frankliniella occidentalis]|nr:hypothetical protein FOCC_FOCC013784 [Frankliniella occidentalis]
MAKGCASFLSGQSHQLTRSLERILEDAHVSGELKLSGRKLKDFPKTGGKYDLSDTVTAVQCARGRAQAQMPYPF